MDWIAMDWIPTLEFEGDNPYPFDDDPPPRNRKRVYYIDMEYIKSLSQSYLFDFPENWGGTKPHRKQLRRNLIILLAHEAGLSDRFISEALELSRSNIAEIIKKLKADCVINNDTTNTH